MEWRKINVKPSNKSGKRGRQSRYTESDVLTFFHDRQTEAVASGICTKEEFEDFNVSFLSEVQKIASWPIPSCSCLGNMYIPVSDAQLKYEKVKPILNTGIFPCLDLKTQVSIWELLDAKTRNKLIVNLSQKEQQDLLTAIITQK